MITHSCMSAASPTVVGGLIFCISATPQPGCLFPLFHGLDTSVTITGCIRRWTECLDTTGRSWTQSAAAVAVNVRETVTSELLG